MSFTWVTPSATACLAAASKYWSSWAFVGSGITLLIRFIAASLNIPVGSPFAFLTNTPPSGEMVDALIPANSMAFEFANAIWLSYLEMNRGWLPVTESIHSLLGSSPPQFSWSQLPSITQVESGCDLQNSLILLMNSWRVMASFNCTLASAYPAERKWVWLSVKPGSRRFP